MWHTSDYTHYFKYSIHNNDHLQKVNAWERTCKLLWSCVYIMQCHIYTVQDHLVVGRLHDQLSVHVHDLRKRQETGYTGPKTRTIFHPDPFAWWPPDHWASSDLLGSTGRPASVCVSCTPAGRRGAVSVQTPSDIWQLLGRWRFSCSGRRIN